MATGKVIGTVQVSVGNVKLVDTEGNLREAGYDGRMFEGEQIYSDDPNALFQIKYSQLPEATAYDGVFRVLADGSVIAGLDGNENMFGDDIDFMETAAGDAGPEGSSAFLEEVAVDEASLLGFGRGADESGLLGGPSGAGELGDADPFNDQPDVLDVTVGDGDDIIYESVDANGEDGTGDDVTTTLTGTLSAIDSNVDDTHVFDTSALVVTSGDIDPSAITIDSFVLTNNEHGDDTPNSADFEIVGNFNALGAGETATLTFTYTATDDNPLVNQPNESDPGTYTIVVTGTNDQPVVTDINHNGEGEVRTGVAVFDNADYVDTSGGEDAESDNLQATLSSQGHDVVAFTDDSASGFETALSGVGTLVMPEAERGDYANLPDGSKEAIYDFVNDGGTLVINASGGGEDTAFLNDMFDWSLSDSRSEGEDGYNITPDADGTQYEGAASTIPDNNGTYTVSTDSLPDGALNLYANDSGDTAVFSVNVGGGTVVFLAYDWYSAQPVGSQDGGWLNILDLAVGNGVSGQEVIYESHDDEDIPGAIDTEADTTMLFTGVIDTVTDDDVNDTHAYELVDGTVRINGELVEQSMVSVFFNEESENWEYTIEGDFNYIDKDDIATITFDYVAIDDSDDNIAGDRADLDIPHESDTSEAATVTLTLTGTNDQPVVTDETNVVSEESLQEVMIGEDGGKDDIREASPVGKELEDARYVGSVADNVSDDDNNDGGDNTHTFAIDEGTLTLSLTTANQAFLSLFDINNLDSFEQFVEGFIHGNLDVSILNEDTDSGVADSVTVATTIDIPQSHIEVLEEYGILNIAMSEDGTYSIQSPLFNLLGAEDSLTIGFDYRATDNAGVGEDNGRDELSESEAATVTLTILGTNDQPVAYEADYEALESTLADTTVGGVNAVFSDSLPGADRGSILADILTRSGMGMDEDLLDTATLTFHLDSEPVTTEVVEREPGDGVDVVDATQTVVQVNEDGTFTVTNATFDNLANGETATVTFQYYIDDESGAVATGDNAHENTQSDPVEVTVTITGTNDQPVIQNVGFRANESHDDTFYANGEDDTQGDSEVLLSKAVGVLSATDDDTNNTHVFNIQNYTASQHYGQGNGGPGRNGDQGDIRFDDVEFFQKGPNNDSDTVKVMIASDPVQVGHLDVSKITFFNNDGNDSQINFEVEGNFDSLAVGETATITFKYIANDKEGFGGGHGGDGSNSGAETSVALDSTGGGKDEGDNESSHSEPKFVTITITGTNDQPMVDTVIEGVEDLIFESDDSTDMIGKDDTKEDVTTLFEGRLTATDDDDNDTHTFHLVEGSVIIDNMPSTDVMIGQSGGGTLGLDNWGVAIDSHTRELTLDNGMVITTSSDAKALSQYDHGADHIGEGIGDRDGSGINVGETITVAMAGGFATSATFGFDGLGGHFRPDGSVQAKATWVAYNNGVEVASGEVDSETNFITIDAGVPFDTVEFSTDSSAGSNWELRYVDAEVIPLDVIIDANGEYDVEGNFNYLAAGETATVTFQYYADDQRGKGTDGDADNEASISEPKTVSVTITGTNDQPVIESVTTDDVIEPNLTSPLNLLFGPNAPEFPEDSLISGQLNEVVQDDDVSDTYTFVEQGSYSFGQWAPVFANVSDSNGVIDAETYLKVNADGSYNVFNQDFNKLGEGENVTVSFDVQVTDGTNDANGESGVSEAKTVTFTVFGTNDQPEARDVGIYDIKEALGDNTNSIYGAFDGRDEDSNDALTYAVISMDRNESVDDIVNRDGYERVFNVLYDADGNGVYEGNVDIAVKLPDGVNLGDIDITGIKVMGGQFVLEGDFNVLPKGEYLVAKFLYNVTDDSGVGAGNAHDESSVSDLGIVTLLVAGTNDVANLSGDTAGGISEDSHQVEDGQLIISDLDAGEAHYRTTYNFEADDSTNSQSLGIFTIDAQGRWTYQLDHAGHGAEIQALNVGLTTEVFTVYSADGTEQQVTITIEGDNDAPVITSEGGGETVTENDVIAGTVTEATVLVDVDATDADSSPLTYTIIGGNSEGYFEINGDGEITLTPLGESEVAASHVNNQTFDLAINVSDGTLSDSTSVSIRVVDNFVDIPTIDLPALLDTGTSDSDDLTSVNQPTLDLGNIATDALNVTIIDDSSVLQAQALRSSVTGLWIVNNAGDGSLSYSGGEWTFTPDSTLADGTHTYTVVVVDDAGNEAHSSLSLNIDTTGPTMDISGVPDSVNETLTYIGQVVATDANGPVVYAVADTDFVIDSEGNLSFAVDENSVPLLSDFEDNEEHSVTVTATDSLGNTSSQDVNFDVNNVTGNISATVGGTILMNTFDDHYSTHATWHSGGWWHHGYYTYSTRYDGYDNNDGWQVPSGHEQESWDHDSGRGSLGWFDKSSDTAFKLFSLDDQAGDTVTINVDVDLNRWESDDDFIMTVYDGNGVGGNVLGITTVNSSGTMSLGFTVPNDGDFRVQFSTHDMDSDYDAWKIDNFEIVAHGETVLSFDSPTEGTIDLSTMLAQGNDFTGGTPNSIDTIDLNGDTSLNISIEDVIDITDNNVLRITSDGGNDNTVTLDANITEVADQTGTPAGFTTYEGFDGTNTVLLTIETTIDVEY